MFYETLRQDQYREMSNNQFKAELRKTLKHASRVETFSLANIPTKKPIKILEGCQDDDCRALKTQIHEDLAIGGYGTFMAQDWGKKIEIILAIIATTRTRVKHVAFQYRQAYLDMYLNILRVFKDFLHVGSLIQDMTLIRWKLEWSYRPSEMNITSVLSSAVNVQRVNIGAPVDHVLFPPSLS